MKGKSFVWGAKLENVVFGSATSPLHSSCLTDIFPAHAAGQDFVNQFFHGLFRFFSGYLQEHRFSSDSCLLTTGTDLDWKSKERERFGDGGPGPAEFFGNLFMSVTEPIAESADSFRFLKCCQVLPLKIFNEGNLQNSLFVGVNLDPFPFFLGLFARASI